MEHVDHLLDRVLVLERFVEVLQAFSVQHSERVQTLSAMLGVPVPPAGPPPATPGLRRVGNTGNTGTRATPATPATPAHSGSADLPAIENSPSAPGVRQPIGTRNSSEALTRREYAILHPPPALATPRAPDPPDFSWRPFRRKNQQSSSGSGRVDPRDT